MGNTNADERTMQITLAERYTLMRLLPERGDFATLTRIKNLRDLLALGDDEAQRRGLAITARGIESADQDSDGATELSRETPVSVSNGMHEIIVGALKGAEQSKALPIEALTLYEKIVRGPDTEAIREAERVARHASDGQE
ncbi:MAG: hypothetical protein NUW01_05970 [Gemmatimonadaceae bacterium]|nr:hypothetical protein [Gemmatimonadaceae bacterium]